MFLPTSAGSTFITRLLLGLAGFAAGAVIEPMITNALARATDGSFSGGTFLNTFLTMGLAAMFMSAWAPTPPGRKDGWGIRLLLVAIITVIRLVGTLAAVAATPELQDAPPWIWLLGVSVQAPIDLFILNLYLRISRKGARKRLRRPLRRLGVEERAVLLRTARFAKETGNEGATLRTMKGTPPYKLLAEMCRGGLAEPIPTLPDAPRGARRWRLTAEGGAALLQHVTPEDIRDIRLSQEAAAARAAAAEAEAEAEAARSAWTDGAADMDEDAFIARTMAASAPPPQTRTQTRPQTSPPAGTMQGQASRGRSASSTATASATPARPAPRSVPGRLAADWPNAPLLYADPPEARQVAAAARAEADAPPAEDPRKSASGARDALGARDRTENAAADPTAAPTAEALSGPVRPRGRPLRMLLRILIALGIFALCLAAAYATTADPAQMGKREAVWTLLGLALGAAGAAFLLPLRRFGGLPFALGVSVPAALLNMALSPHIAAAFGRAPVERPLEALAGIALGGVLPALFGVLMVGDFAHKRVEKRYRALPEETRALIAGAAQNVLEHGAPAPFPIRAGDAAERCMQAAELRAWAASTGIAGTDRADGAPVTLWRLNRAGAKRFLGFAKKHEGAARV